jgi:hypothetical protein
MSHYKRIETSREIRLWIGIAIPAITAIIATASNPDVRQWCGDKWNKLKNKFSKKEEGL